MHSSNSRAVHFAPPAGGLLNAQGAQGRPLHTSPAKFLCIFLSCCYFETTRVARAARRRGVKSWRNRPSWFIAQVPSHLSVMAPCAMTAPLKGSLWCAAFPQNRKRVCRGGSPSRPRVDRRSTPTKRSVIHTAPVGAALRAARGSIGDRPLQTVSPVRYPAASSSIRRRSGMAFSNLTPYQWSGSPTVFSMHKTV